jgi:hypothetical protein
MPARKGRNAVLEHFKRERSIRKALHAIARQRVVLVLQPGNVLVVELSPPNEEWFDIAVRTCHIRGWVDVLHDSIPSGAVRYDGSKPVFPGEMKSKAIYRLTEGGWSVIHRSHAWLIATFVVGLLSLVAGIASVLVTLVTANPSIDGAAAGKPASAIHF